MSGNTTREPNLAMPGGRFHKPPLQRSAKVAVDGIPNLSGRPDERKFLRLPKGDQFEDQNQQFCPLPTICLIQGLLTLPPRPSQVNQEAQMESVPKKRIQMSFKAEAMFQVDKSFKPRPPSSLDVVTDCHATLAVS